MTDIIDTLYSWLSFLPKISRTNILEIVIIAFLIYEIMVWIKNTRAWTLLDFESVYYFVDPGKDRPGGHHSSGDYFSAGA